VDVLQIIKTDHDRVRSLLAQLEVAEPQSKAKLFAELSLDLRVHSKIEESYLYPEVSSLASEKFPGFFDFCIANHRTIARTLATMQKALAQGHMDDFNKYRESLSKVIKSHFAAEEDNLMPLLRRYVPTAEREELGVVFEDLRHSPDILVEERAEASRKRNRA
jgi:hemerythrin superfamily protein